MDRRIVPSERFARAAALAAMCFLLGSGYASAEQHALIRGLARQAPNPRPPTRTAERISASRATHRKRFEPPMA
jgi:hypothetical protein